MDEKSADYGTQNFIELKAQKGMGFMKRKIMAMALAASMAATMLAGCSSSSSNVETTTTKSGETTTAGNGQAATGGVVDGYESYAKRTDLTTEDITLTVWESANGPDEFIKQAAQDFQKIYPNITIKFDKVESTDAKDKIAADGPSGLGPDLFAAANDNLGTMAAAGSIQPLDDVDASYVQAVKDNTEEICVNGVTYDNKVWGFPVARETYTILYNKSLIESIPDNWEDLVKACEEWNAAHKGKYALMWEAGNTYHNVFWLTGSTVNMFGENHDDFSKGIGFNNETSIKNAKYYQSLRKRILDVKSGDLDQATIVSAFENGECAMVIDGSWKIGAYEKALGDNLAAATLPKLPGEDKPVSNFAGIRTMYVSYYSEYPKEAAAFGEFLMCKEMQQKRLEITSSIPCRNDVNIDDEVMKVFIEQLDNYSFAMPSIPQINMYWTCYNTLYQSIWNGDDPAKLISDAEELFIGFTAEN